MKAGLLLLWRDWRGGELNILIFSLILATATITSISIFVSRIQNSILDEASHFLAADAQVRGSLAPLDTWLQKAEELQIETATSNNFRAMIFAEEKLQLGRVKAVSQTYPLKGRMQLSKLPFGDAYEVSHAPPPGEAWLASRLFGLLDINVGDQIQLGEATLTVSAAIIKEPDSPQSFFGVAPRVIMNIQDIALTKVIQVGSRVNHTWMLKADAKKIDEFKQWIEPLLGEHHRWVSVEDGNRGIADALTRAERFLLLAGSLCVILSGLAIAIAARRYADRQSKHVALLKTFGQTPANITRLYALNLVALGALGVTLGGILGWFLHQIMLAIISSFLPSELASPGFSAYTTGALSCLVALMAFAAPPLINLRKVPPAKVLRNDIKTGSLSEFHAGVIGVFAVLALVYWYSSNLSMTLIVALGGVFCLAGVWLLASLLISASRKLSNILGNNWRLGLANLQRHKRSNSLQIMIFSVLIMLLLVMTVTRTGLLNQWQKQIPEDAPNHFVFNIFPNEKLAINTLFENAKIDRQPFYPMVRGRILNINEDLLSDRAENSTNRMNYVRELNLTWSDSLGNDNEIINGQWWNHKTATELLVSAEKEYAEGVGIKVGDTLTFSIAGQQVAAKVASLRSVQWDSMNPNFFMIFNKPLLDGSTANWLTSFYLPPEQKLFLNELTRKHPTVSLVELDQMMNQVRGIIGQVSLAVEFVLSLILIAGTLVLITSIQATLDIRKQESAILRTLGANRKLVNFTLLIEFTSLGFLAGLLAAIGAEVTLYFLQTHMFNLDHEIHWLMLLSGPVFGAILIGGIGWLSTRSVTRTPPLTILRNTA